MRTASLAKRYFVERKPLKPLALASILFRLFLLAGELVDLGIFLQVVWFNFLTAALT